MNSMGVSGGAGEARSLLRAVGQQRLDLVEKLLKDETIDVNFQHPEEGETPLVKAVELGGIEIVKALVEYGADVNLEANVFSEGTPADIAKKRGFKEIEMYLVEHGGEYSTSHAEVDIFSSGKKGGMCTIQ